ncbi:hypothetical protein IFM89_024190 [Coptis chinensis]|uniref:Uncharacterized protein n=1 Tax=Coptis chinensis TaxID=261450 RepID=A0A835M0K1_9MAGN|nr:hypothetical protein IFM89_024190 [Coptis chinensis]
MSDIVFLQAWTEVEFPSFFNSMTAVLQPCHQTWQGMKTVSELREHNLPVSVNKDSLYKERERERKLKEQEKQKGKKCAACKERTERIHRGDTDD